MFPVSAIGSLGTCITSFSQKCTQVIPCALADYQRILCHFLLFVFKQTVASQLQLHSIEFDELQFGEFLILDIVYMAQSCCNPFDIPGHTWSSRRRNLRPVTAWMCERAPHISIDSKICDTCRKKLRKESQDVTEPILSEPDLPALLVHKPQSLILSSLMLQRQHLHSSCIQQKSVRHHILRVKPVQRTTPDRR